MGRWSARLASPFVRFACAGNRLDAVDVGCGTGSLTRALLAADAAHSVVAVDPVAQYVSFAQRRTRDSRARFEVGAAEALPFADQTFDAALGLLILQDVADPRWAVDEMARLVRRGGSVSTCLWDFRHRMPMLSLFWRAAEAVAPQAVAERRAARPPYHPGRDELTALWMAAGLDEVRALGLEISMEFASFDDFWRPFLGGGTPTSVFARDLDDATGGDLARALRSEIRDIRLDGSFVLHARAWAVTGTTIR